MVLDSAIFALGRLGNLNAIPTILTYQDHPDQGHSLLRSVCAGLFPQRSPRLNEAHNGFVFGCFAIGTCFATINDLSRSCEPFTTKAKSPVGWQSQRRNCWG
jgi:hypothetical protein